MFNGNSEKMWLILIDHRNCGCQLFSDKLIYVYIYIYILIFHSISSMGRFTNKQLGCQPLYTISYKQYSVTNYIPSVIYKSQCSKPEMTSLEKLLS